MDFKFTKVKTIVSIIVTFITFIIGLIIFNSFIGCFPSPCSLLAHIKFAIGPTIIVLLILYVIWSLIQKKIELQPIKTNQTITIR